FQTQAMGSWVYAWRCNQRNEKIVAALSLETIGYFTSKPNSQKYPEPFGMIYPTEGNFIGVIGNVGSRQLVRQIVAAFREHGQFPSEGAAIPANIVGVGWSDHWSFWQTGYPALMVTDTALFRDPNYHQLSDTIDKLDFERLTRVVLALQATVLDLAQSPAP
ncbi:MAG TPA: M28 family peptidase, partial [Polyangiaceae bacterium]|nr:M28 family peptidase [Polyangiaceae bacterium]